MVDGFRADLGLRMPPASNAEAVVADGLATRLASYADPAAWPPGSPFPRLLADAAAEIQALRAALGERDAVQAA